MIAIDGTPVWFELNTPDPAAAGAFYAKVMDWHIGTSPMPEHGDYTLAGPAENDAVAGMMTPPGDMGTPGWSVYFAVPDVDAAAEKVSTLGGRTVFGPMDIPHVGRFAIALDPAGIPFTLLAGSSDEPAKAFVQDPYVIGHGAWIELATPDPDRAFAFYGALFGWEKAGGMSMPVLSDAAGGVEGGDIGEYSFIGAGDARPGAIMPSTTTGAPARWNWYVYVADIDHAIAAATDAGGRLIQGPDQIPGGDYSANILDPHGTQIGLVGARRGAVQ